MIACRLGMWCFTYCARCTCWGYWSVHKHNYCFSTTFELIKAGFWNNVTMCVNFKDYPYIWASQKVCQAFLQFIMTLWMWTNFYHSTAETRPSVTIFHKWKPSNTLIKYYCFIVTFISYSLAIIDWWDDLRNVVKQALPLVLVHNMTVCLLCTCHDVTADKFSSRNVKSRPEYTVIRERCNKPPFECW